MPTLRSFFVVVGQIVAIYAAYLFFPGEDSRFQASNILILAAALWMHALVMTRKHD